MSAEATNLIQTKPGIVPVDANFQGDKEREQQERDRTANCPELLTFINRTCDSIKAKDLTSWERIINDQVRCIAYYDDRQYGTVRDGEFRDWRIEPGDVRPIDNRYKVQIDKLAMEIVRSFPRIEVTATDPNDTRKAEAAKFAQSRIDAARKRMMKANERQREAQALLLKKITYRYVYFDSTSKHSPKERRPKKQERDYGSTRSVVSCADCGGPMKRTVASIAQDSEQDQYKCVECGSANAKVVQLGVRKMQVASGYEEVRGGNVESQHIDPMMVRISLSARQSVADSPYLWYSQRIARCILEDSYPHVRIKNSSGDLNIAERHKVEAQNTPSNSTDYTVQNATPEAMDPQGGDQLEECPYDLFWLDPVMYRRVKFSKPQRLLGGRELPANVELGKLFPDGMCVAKNVDQVLNMYPENKNRQWLFCVYGIREHALHGSGTSNLLGPQDTRNELKALLISNAHYNGTPREFIREGAITDDRLPALNEVAIVSGVPNDKPMENWGYTKAAPSPLPDQTVALYESENGAMQEGAGTSSLSGEGAAADIKALGTATGVAAMRDQAVGRMGPNLQLITSMEEEWGYMVLEHELEYFSPQRFMSMANQAVTAQQTDGSITFSADGIRAFMECDPRCDLNVAAAPGSWMPKTEAERQAAFQQFATFCAVVMEKLASDPATAEQLISSAATAWGVEGINLGGWTATEQTAAQRLRDLAHTVEVLAKRRVTQVTEENVAEVIMNTPEAAVNNEMDNHLLFMRFYHQWWASDEGASCPPLLKKVVEAVCILHRKGLVYQVQQKNTDEIEGNAPKEQKAAEIAAAAAAQGGGKENKEPSVTLPYKEAPEDIRRQIEADAGYTPSQMGAGTQDTGDAEINKELVKVEGQKELATHKAQLDSQREQEKAQLEVDKATAIHQLDEQRAEGDHSRSVELETIKQEHQAGMEGAKLMHQSATAAEQRVHDATQKDKDRAAKRIDTKRGQRA